MEGTTRAGCAVTSEREAYEALQCYTLAHGDPSFIHQQVVDAFAAQTADEGTKPITLAFALIGLYLHVEKGFSGKQVQRAHMFFAQRKRIWPSFPLPHDRGSMTVADVMAVAAGVRRDKAIHEWCAAVWKPFHESHQMVGELARELFVRTNSFRQEEHFLNHWALRIRESLGNPRPKACSGFICLIYNER